MDAITVTIFAAVILLVYFFWRSPKKNLPPGPRALPLVGNILSLLSGDFLRYMENQRKKYGEICTIWFATNSVVCVSGYKNVYEAFVTKADVCSGRPKFVGTEEFSGGHGILLQDGEAWKHMRRFALTALRDLGFGKKGTEEKILEEASFVVAEIDKFSGKTWSGTKSLFNKASGNIICRLIYGSRFDYTDKAFTDLLQRLRDAVSSPEIMSLFDVLPSSMSFLKPKFIESSFSRFANASKAFTREQIDVHRKTYDADNIRDFVDCYIKVASEGSDKVTEEDMFGTILELFIAGTETSATTLDWAILYMMGHPDIQAQCQKQIDTEIGRNRAIRTDDKKKLPLVEATMLEVMRHAAIVPLGVSHRATEDFELCGYDIPKDATVLGNLYSVLRDPDHWEDPDRFNPSRFLSADGSVLKQTALIPFSIGPRVCLGETLARTEVFIIFANLLQNFIFSKVPDDQEDYLSRYNCPAEIRSAVNYKTKVTKRD